MGKGDQLKRLYTGIETIRNAAMSVSSDISSFSRTSILADFSILFGSIYPYKAQNPHPLISPASASSTTVSVYNELGDKSPISIIIPPATIAEIIHSLRREAVEFRRVGDNPERIDLLASHLETIHQMTADDVSNILTQVPGDNHVNGINNLAQLFRSGHFKTCIEAFGRDNTINAHKAAKGQRDRLLQTFQDHRGQRSNETFHEYTFRNWADADNISLAPILSDMQATSTNKILYGGPIPTFDFLTESDRKEIVEYQRNFVAPFLSVTLAKQGLQASELTTMEAIAISSRLISQKCDTAIDSIPISKYDLSLTDLLPEQMSAIISVVESVTSLKEIATRQEEAFEMKKEELANKLKKRATLKDGFLNHAASLEGAADSLFTLLPELNDDEMLDEFSLKAMRDSGNANWLVPKS